MMDVNPQPLKSYSASFDLTDDLLWQARASKLVGIGNIEVRGSGRVGPLVELAFAGIETDEYAKVSVRSTLFQQILEGLEEGRISGGNYGSIAGAFPLSRYDRAGVNSSLWDQWCKHVENAAVALGHPKAKILGLIGALGELQDNVFEHSGKPETGIAVYGVTDKAFEFVVGDCGIGVLATLKQNPEFADLDDSGQALVRMASDGASRFGRNTGHGFGISRLFRSLADEFGELRFRSGDHALRVWGDSPNIAGQYEIAQKAWLGGLTVSVRYSPNRSVL